MPVSRPTIGIMDALETERRVGESLFETAKRVLTFEAFDRANGVQRRAAKSLGITPRMFNYDAAHYGLRPKDRRHG